MSQYRAPRDCPVCDEELHLSRVGCPSCGTEIIGEFQRCSFCALDDADVEMLRVFLASRGNMREVGKYLGVSYPTARQRYSELLVKLGMAGADDEAIAQSIEQILAAVADGAITAEHAERLLALA
ncbi:MAG: DUF2089 domain-containing protein [Propionibacteriaceae bacterium]